MVKIVQTKENLEENGRPKKSVFENGRLSRSECTFESGTLRRVLLSMDNQDYQLLKWILIFEWEHRFSRLV